MSGTRQLALVLLSAAVANAAARAQAPPGPLPPRPSVSIQQAPPPEAKAAPQIKVQVDLVRLPVTVSDSQGELVLDLGQQDFRVFDNGVARRIEHFDLGGDPLSVVLVAETSSRVEALLPAIRKAGIVFTETVLGPSGEAAVLGFNDDSTILVPFTTDHDRLDRAIDRLPEGTSGVRLYDALSRAVEMLRQRPTNRRRVIVCIAEAIDTGSEEKLGAVLRQAQLANATIYTVGLSTTAAELRASPRQTAPPQVGPPGTFPEPPLPGRPQTPSMQQAGQANIDLMGLVVWIVERATNTEAARSLAVASAATGGLHVSTFRDRSIETALDRIGGELHAQYTLAYRPSGTETRGYHETKVTVSRPGLQVRTRPGYFLAPPPT